MSAERGTMIYGDPYGLGFFQFLPEEEALGTRVEVAAVNACATVGEARELAPTLRFIHIPGLAEHDEDESPDDEPFNAFDYEDWPAVTHPGGWALESLSEEFAEALCDQAGAREVDHFPFFPTFDVPAAGEEALVRLLSEVGFTVRRDDALIGSLTS